MSTAATAPLEMLLMRTRAEYPVHYRRQQRTVRPLHRRRSGDLRMGHRLTNQNQPDDNSARHITSQILLIVVRDIPRAPAQDGHEVQHNFSPHAVTEDLVSLGRAAAPVIEP